MSDLFHNSIWFIPASVFIAGLIGSPHCLAMCGPIVFNFASYPRRLFAYQIGRMSTYTLAGYFAGRFGHAILGSESPLWISSIALLLMAVLLVLNGYRAVNNRALHFAVPKILNQYSSRLWKAVGSSKCPKTAGAALGGAMTVFLPCGHLYGFLLGAVATGGGFQGAVFMFAFWLGSTPLLSFGSAWFHRLLKPGVVNGQRWAGLLLMVAGLFSLGAFALRMSEAVKPHHGVTALDHASTGSPAPRCH